MYLALEGIDTAGKSTQISALRALFSDAIVTKEPGGTPLGNQLRSMILGGELSSPMGELFLFLADRAEHAQTVLAPNRDKLIISDRSLISGIAYALIQNICSLETLIELNTLATGGMFPDQVVILQLTPHELSHRLGQKSHDAIEARGTQYLLTIQDALIQAALALGITPHIIDASQSVEEITHTLTTLIKGHA